MLDLVFVMFSCRTITFLSFFNVLLGQKSAFSEGCLFKDFLVFTAGRTQVTDAGAEVFCVLSIAWSLLPLRTSRSSSARGALCPPALPLSLMSVCRWNRFPGVPCCLPRCANPAAAACLAGQMQCTGGRSSGTLGWILRSSLMGADTTSRAASAGATLLAFSTPGCRTDVLALERTVCLCTERPELVSGLRLYKSDLT